MQPGAQGRIFWEWRLCRGVFVRGQSSAGQHMLHRLCGFHASSRKRGMQRPCLPYSVAQAWPLESSCNSDLETLPRCTGCSAKPSSHALLLAGALHVCCHESVEMLRDGMSWIWNCGYISALQSRDRTWPIFCHLLQDLRPGNLHVSVLDLFLVAGATVWSGIF